MNKDKLLKRRITQESRFCKVADLIEEIQMIVIDSLDPEMTREDVIANLKHIEELFENSEYLFVDSNRTRLAIQKEIVPNPSVKPKALKTSN